MLPRSSKYGRNHTSPSTSLLSPPTQQPTPLPEPQLDNPAMSLVDVASLTSHDDDDDHPDEDLSATYIYNDTRYRSPPFREASLPDSPQPLPIPPRVYQSLESIMDLDDGTYNSPISSPHPYIIHQPQTSPHNSPHRFAQDPFQNSKNDVYHPQPTRPGLSLDTHVHYSSYHPSTSTTTIPHRIVSPTVTVAALGASGGGKESGLAQAMRRGGYEDDQLRSPLHLPRKPTLAKWDEVDHAKVLMMAYEGGVVRVYSCKDLGAVEEVMSVVMTVEEVIGEGKSGTVRVVDLAQVTTRVPEAYQSVVVVYSLLTHQVVNRVRITAVGVSMQVANHFVVVGTVSPASIIILSSSTLNTLYTIPESSLQLFAIPSVPYHNPSDRLSIRSPQWIERHDEPNEGSLPRPIFSLNNRLLAYASPTVAIPSSSLLALTIPTAPHRPFSSSSAPSSYDVGSLASAHSHSTSTSTASSTSSALNAIGGGLRHLASLATGSSTVITQKELTHAAIKVGESVFTGIRFLGGKAVEALSSGVDGDEYPREDVIRRIRDRERRADPSDQGKREPSDHPTTIPAGSYEPPTTILPEKRTTIEKGSYVAVVDLSHPTLSKVSQFRVSKSQSISRLSFTPDGTSLGAVLADGHFVRIFKLNLKGGSTHVYNLRRGRTYASIEACQMANDGRWTAITTNHRTVHVFATNPYGGPTDVASHYQGRVRNVQVVQFPLTELHPVARLRPRASFECPTPLAVTFLNPSHTHFQDILLFDPADSTLSLHRLTLDQVRESAVTSISLPGLGLSSSSPITRALTDVELSVKESVVATWSLDRAGEWLEVRKPWSAGTAQKERGGDWLAQAEITTCSKSTRVLPRSLYLSHQFSFYTLGEDYHALIRRLHLDIVGPKMQVRTTVPIHTPGAFMQDFTSPLTGPSPPSFDFDEPLAHAISGSFDHRRLPSILPMFPNGSTKPKSFRHSIPIKTMKEGVSEGIGRLKSQINRGAGSVDPSGSVPLEFDEQDEDFLETGVHVEGYSHGLDFMNADVVGTVDEEIFQVWEAPEVHRG